MTRLKQLFYPVLFQILLYAVQFIIAPRIYYISPYDVMRSIVFIVISVCLITTWGMVRFSHNYIGWILGLFVYAFLVIVYHPNNLYGIGSGMFDFDLITIGIFVLLTFVLQLLIWVILRIYTPKKNKR